MLKAEKLLKEYKSLKMGGKRMIPPNALMEIEFGELMELLDKVKLLETSQNKSCEGCKWDYTIENRDMDTNERLDDLMPKACYMCCNAHQLQWEAKV